MLSWSSDMSILFDSESYVGGIKKSIRNNQTVFGENQLLHGVYQT